MTGVKKIALLAALTLGLARADDVQLKPFVLAYRTTGEVARAAEEAKAKLAAAGFELVGAYEPYESAAVLVVTSPELKAAAAKSKFGAYAAGQRVTVTRVSGEVQVSYTNPVYMQYAYRMEADLAPVAAKLAAALGHAQEFGPGEGKTASELRKYHYMMGMEYFDEPNTLATYPSHEAAVQAVEAGLAAGKQGVTKVYRVDVPGKKEVLFGVAMKGDGDAAKFMDDRYIMNEIDFRDLKSTAHLPYDLLVSDNKVYAQYARFRIAISFPDLSMMGSNSFMNIMKSPEAIRRALALTAGGKEDAR